MYFFNFRVKLNFLNILNKKLQTIFHLLSIQNPLDKVKKKENSRQGRVCSGGNLRQCLRNVFLCVQGMAIQWIFGITNIGGKSNRTIRMQTYQRLWRHISWNTVSQTLNWFFCYVNLQRGTFSKKITRNELSNSLVIYL